MFCRFEGLPVHLEWQLLAALVSVLCISSGWILGLSLRVARLFSNAFKCFFGGVLAYEGSCLAYSTNSLLVLFFFAVSGGLKFNLYVNYIKQNKIKIGRQLIWLLPHTLVVIDRLTKFEPFLNLYLSTTCSYLGGDCTIQVGTAQVLRIVPYIDGAVAVIRHRTLLLTALEPCDAVLSGCTLLQGMYGITLFSTTAYLRRILMELSPPADAYYV